MASIFGEKIPIMLGPMAIETSRIELPVAVAKEGGIATITITGHKPEDIRKRILAIRERAGKEAILFVNVMDADNLKLVRLKAALDTGEIDGVSQGAGVSRDVPRMCEEYKKPFVPIICHPSQVSFYRDRLKFKVAAWLVEGGDAGGHDGDINMSVVKRGDKTLETIKEMAEKTSVIAAGNIRPSNIKRVLSIADVVQLATSMIVTEESARELPIQVIELYRRAKEEDVVLIDSPVGYYGRALNTKLVQDVKASKVFPPNEVYNTTCVHCLKKCLCRDSGFTKSFCIISALRKVIDVDDENFMDFALFFCSKGIGIWNEIISVRQVIEKYLHPLTI